MKRFVDGGGELFDLEYLVDEQGRRVAAFGHWAGYAGAALALLCWCGQEQKLEPVLPAVQSRADQHELLSEVRAQLSAVGKVPQVIVIGALGRSGRGAAELCKQAGCEVIEWDIAETNRGGPFPEILATDVLLNCVFIQKSIPPFLTREMLDSDDRRLSVICDVSCDPYGDYNPLPIYSQCTTFDSPTSRIVDGDRPVDLIAIDHLPSLLPMESSEDFCNQLMPHLLQVNNLDEGVWKRARELFEQKISLI